MEKNTLTVPIAIVLAGALIGGALIFSNRNSSGGTPANTAVKSEALEINIRPIDTSDHIVGNPDAKAVLVEYSDTECPYCKRFHETLRSISDSYGKDGNFAWVYRHYPLVALHSKAPKEAEATECAAELGGNTKFWEYTNMLYETTTSNDGLSPAELPKIAEKVGLDKQAFESCLNSGRYTAKVAKDTKEASDVGARGTPYSVFVLKSAPSKDLKEFVEFNNLEITKRLQPGSGDVMGISKDQRKIFVSGAMPEEMMKSIVDLILK